MSEVGARTLRLFVACELSDEVRRALGRLQDDLRRLGAERLRWVRPEGIHVTLKFLGEVEESGIDAIRAALRDTVAPFSLTVRPASLGTFGGARVRVVWVGLEGDVDGLTSLAAAIDGALEDVGFPRERRPFAAHLTLARVPDGVEAQARQQFRSLIERYRPAELPSMTLTKVNLIQSTLGPGGSVYTRLDSFPPGP